MKIAKCILSLALALTIASGAVAGDGEKKEAKGEKAAAGQKGDKAKKGGEEAAKRRDAAAKKRAAAGKKGERRAPALSAFMLRGIELSAEQKEAVAPIDKEFGPKMAELRKAQNELLTKEQKDAVAAIFAKVRESKQKPTPEIRKEMAAARKLSPEQQEKAKELGAAQQKLRADYLAKVDVILTPEQKETLKKSRGGRRDGARKPGEGAKKPAGERRKKDGAKKDGEKKPEAK